MALSESQLRIGTIMGAVLLVGVITYVRFCGSLSLPPKPPPPAAPSGTSRQILSRSAETPTIYKGFVEQDAQLAGVPVPTIEEMSRKLAYHVDDPRPGYVLEPGKPPIEVAGLALHVERTGETIVLVAANRLASAVAYKVTTKPSVGANACASARLLPVNAMVLAKGATATRTECSWREGEAILVTKVETLEVPPLSAWYLSQVPPALVGIEDRIARGHSVATPCSPVMPASVANGIERGEIEWRDLADFYARHRCQTYQFPYSYRALKSDGERPLPAAQ
jgi:hypothetical protein